jgi:hypothetical protein
MAVEPAKVPIIFRSDRRLTAGLSVSLMALPPKEFFCIFCNLTSNDVNPEQDVCRGVSCAGTQRPGQIGYADIAR